MGGKWSEGVPRVVVVVMLVRIVLSGTRLVPPISVQRWDEAVRVCHSCMVDWLTNIGEIRVVSRLYLLVEQWSTKTNATWLIFYGIYEH